MKNSCVVLPHIWHSRAHKTENLQQRPALNIEKIQNNPQVYTQKKTPFSGKLVLQGKRTRKKLEKCSITGIELQNIAWNQAGKPMNPQKIDLCLLCGKRKSDILNPWAQHVEDDSFPLKDPTRWLIMNWQVRQNSNKIVLQQGLFTIHRHNWEGRFPGKKNTHTHTHTHTSHWKTTRAPNLPTQNSSRQC